MMAWMSPLARIRIGGSFYSAGVAKNDMLVEVAQVFTVWTENIFMAN